MVRRLFSALSARPVGSERDKCTRSSHLRTCTAHALSLLHRRPGTLRPLPTDALAIPMLCLGGRLPDKQGAVITLDLSNAAAAPGGGAAADLTAWGEFHNGVAAGEPVAFGAPTLSCASVLYSAEVRQTSRCWCIFRV